MNYLLDTCTFLWLTGQSKELSSTAREICQSTENLLYLSPVSAWEIEVKYRKGDLVLARPPEIYIPAERRKHYIFELPFEEDAALNYNVLPSVHKDPFDRMLVCQAIEHGLILLTPDKKIKEYPAETAW